jgi:uncharacterized protein
VNRQEPDSDVASPCISVCTIDQVTGLCAGCYRTLEEIAAWGGLSADEKRVVIATLVGRRALYGEGVTSRNAANGDR